MENTDISKQITAKNLLNRSLDSRKLGYQATSLVEVSN